MAVFRKKRENGTLSENWYYKFVVNGKRYRGSTYKSDKDQAQEFEEDLKRKIKALHDDRPIVSEKEKERNLLNFREKITSEIQGESIALDDVWDVFKAKAPAMMRKIPNEKGWDAKKSYWEDFLAYLKDRHENCKSIRDVSADMAGEYVSILKTSGKFNKTISTKNYSYQNKVIKLSPSSINEYITQLKQIFRIMKIHGGLIENPFSNVKKLNKQSKKREVYDLHELEKIDSFLSEGFSEHKDKFSTVDLYIIRAIFYVGLHTGLRKGDICLLKWDDVNFQKGAIEKEISKTGENVFIPISEKLKKFLLGQKDYQGNKSEYVNYILANSYILNPDGISYRFKKMLKHLEIKSVKEHEDRSRRTSSKDIHSLRHTFCYLHGMMGTPLVVVQSMVGHMDKKMTEAYMMHQTEELKRDAIKRMAFNSFNSDLPNLIDDKKKNLIEQIENCKSEEMIESLSKAITKPDDENESRGMKW